MAKKKHPGQPSEVPLPVGPEILPESTPEEPESPNEPEIVPEPAPHEPESPPELT